MKRRLLKTFFIFSLLLTLLVGCGKKKANDVKTAKKNIGISGGEVSASDNLKLNIPKDALNKDEEISIEYFNDEKAVSDDPSINFLGMAIFSPSGTTFNSEATATIKLANKTNSSSVSVFYLNEDEGIWYYETDATVSKGMATFKINHFSKYKVLDLSVSMFDKYRDIVLNAKTGNKSDSWITDEYYNYLVNEEHILDYYTKFNGAYYEAVGLSISGDYYYYGVEGNQNYLIKQYGEFGNVGNKFGLSTVGSVSETKITSKIDKSKATSDQILTTVSISISYRIIKPTIELTAKKTDLNKGEKETVNVYCHYENPKNYFYKDFALDGLNLTLPYELKCFETNKQSLETDENGKTSFTVKALGKGSETIKVMFYVEGIFGDYSSAFITFSCGSEVRNFHGHISEELIYNVGTYDDADDDFIINKLATVSLNVSYDFTGSYNVTDEKNTQNVFGSMSISNVKATFSSDDYDFIVVHKVENQEVNYKPFDDFEIELTNAQNIGFTGMTINGSISTFPDADGSEINIVLINATERYITNDPTASQENPSKFTVSLGGYASPLLSFKNSKGTYTKTVDYFANQYVAGASKLVYGYYVFDKVSEKTTQTITIEN